MLLSRQRTIDGIGRTWRIVAKSIFRGEKMRLWRKRFPGTENLIKQLPSEVFAESDGWDANLTAYIEDGKTGGVNPGDRRLLYQLTRWLKPRTVLEIGTHVGASTMHIAAAKPHSITTVDIMDVNAPDSYWHKAGLPMSPRDALRGARVNFIRDDSISFLDRTTDKFDLIFLDGAHSYEKMLAEIPRALKCLAKDGLILLHDYFPDGNPLWKEEPVTPGPFEAVRELQRHGADFKVTPFGELPWPTKRGGNLTSLAALLGT
jgi:predicted O-methyltransferase YrrM